MLRDPLAAEIGSQEADVYAASVVMHETFTCAPPFGLDPNDNAAVESTLQRLLSHDDSTPTHRPSVSTENPNWIFKEGSPLTFA